MTTSGPSRGLLHEWVSASLALTARAVASVGDDGPDVDPEKVVGEAMLLLRSTARLGTVDGQVAAAWQRLHDVVAPLARPETLPLALCLRPGLALEQAFAHVQLSALGDPDPQLDSQLDIALGEPTHGPEPSVVGALHHAWLLGLHTRTPDRAHLDDLLRRSSLGRPVDVLRCSTQDVYDLTHAVMHATDLGSWPVTLPRAVEEILEDLDALLGIALDADNLDVTTELLWAWPMLGLPATAASRFAWRVVDRAFAELGFVPGPGFDAAQHGMLPAGEAATYVLRTSYHATLVAGILAASMLNAEPTTTTAPALGSPGRGPRLLDAIGPEPRRGWRRLAPDAGPDGLDRLGPMLLTIALRRASDRFDLPDVRRLLQLALELDLADGPAVRQAVALLRRGAVLASRPAPSRSA